MCTENTNDIPIRTIVRRSERGWTAHCLDFNLEATADEPNDALDMLDGAIEFHLEKARQGEVELFRAASKDLWDLYYKAAEVKLLKSGPGHGHVEHRPLMLESALVV